MTAGQLLENLGFAGERAWTPVSDLSGGERRRLQLLRLLMGEPNVLLLDEPTNDLDTDTLAAARGRSSTAGPARCSSSATTATCSSASATVRWRCSATAGSATCPAASRSTSRCGGPRCRRPRPAAAPEAAARRPTGPRQATLRTARKEMARLERQLARLADAGGAAARAAGGERHRPRGGARPGRPSCARSRPSASRARGRVARSSGHSPADPVGHGSARVVERGRPRAAQGTPAQRGRRHAAPSDDEQRPLAVEQVLQGGVDELPAVRRSARRARRARRTGPGAARTRARCSSRSIRLVMVPLVTSGLGGQLPGGQLVGLARPRRSAASTSNSQTSSPCAAERGAPGAVRGAAASRVTRDSTSQRSDVEVRAFPPPGRDDPVDLVDGDARSSPSGAAGQRGLALQPGQPVPGEVDQVRGDLVASWACGRRATTARSARPCRPASARTAAPPSRPSRGP